MINIQNAIAMLIEWERHLIEFDVHNILSTQRELKTDNKGNLISEISRSISVILEFCLY